MSLASYLPTIENRGRADSGGRPRPFAVPELTTLEIMSGVLAALEALHSLTPSPLAHRDVKAENVLLAADGASWKLCDFGSASACSATFGSPSSGGAAAREQLLIDRTTTPAYRPPEMWDVALSGQQVGTKVDVWMLGCLLYRICFGRLPFADNKLQIMVRPAAFPPGPPTRPAAAAAAARRGARRRFRPLPPRRGHVRTGDP